MRLLLVTHADIAYDVDRYDNALVAALRDLADVTIVEWENMKAPSVRAAAAGRPLTDFDVVMIYIRFRFRMGNAEPFDWTGFSGLRVMMEHDAWWNYVPGSGLTGAYPPAFKRDRFDLMIATGANTCERLALDGVPAAWMPKGYDDRAFFDLGVSRTGACTYGTAWASRRAMVRRIRRRGVPLADVSGPFSSLNHQLNVHAAGVVCNMPSVPPFGRVGRRLSALLPELVRPIPAIEPMIKTFETAASGCALVVDHVSDLEDLGFVHGETCLVYRTFDEAAQLLRETSPEDLLRIGRAGAAEAKRRHTWRHRAERAMRIFADPQPMVDQAG